MLPLVLDSCKECLEDVAVKNVSKMSQWVPSGRGARLCLKAKTFRHVTCVPPGENQGGGSGCQETHDQMWCRIVCRS